MQCPRCKHELKTIMYEEVEIETCPGCEGEWLDEGELKRIVDAWEEKFTKEEIASIDSVDKTELTHDDAVTGHLKCPKCPDATLERFNYAGTSGIALDRCPRCGGIWLDKNELEQVQHLVEEWNKKLADDMGEYGRLLSRVKESTAERVDSGYAVGRFGFVNAILRRFLK